MPTCWRAAGAVTRQIERMGQRVLVAGRDGASYGARDWAHSQTFWQGSQENLIIADNQTRSYEQGDLAVRRALSGHAWGQLAAPAEPDPGRSRSPSRPTDLRRSARMTRPPAVQRRLCEPYDARMQDQGPERVPGEVQRVTREDRAAAGEPEREASHPAETCVRGR